MKDKMTEYIIDTNVPLIAQGKSDFSSECESNCANFMDEILNGSHIVVIDDDYYIMGEYEPYGRISSQLTYMRSFLKWIYSNLANPLKVKRVSISEDAQKAFCEVPNKIHNIGFDSSDLKFVAVAVSNNYVAPIVEAGDSKWIGWEPTLNEEGIKILFLCKEELEIIYTKKMR